MNGSSQQSSRQPAPGRAGWQLVAWLAVILQGASGPVAAISHQHEHGAGGCCSRSSGSGGADCSEAGSTGVAAARRLPGHSRAEAAAVRTCRTGGHACRFSRCRDSLRHAERAPQSEPQQRHGEPVVRSGTASPPCLACQFLAKHVAVIPWTWSDTSCLARWDDPAVHPIRIAAPRAAAFLARGPPA